MHFFIISKMNILNREASILNGLLIQARESFYICLIYFVGFGKQYTHTITINRCCSQCSNPPGEILGLFNGSSYPSVWCCPNYDIGSHVIGEIHFYIHVYKYIFK